MHILMFKIKGQLNVHLAQFVIKVLVQQILLDNTNTAEMAPTQS